MLMGETYCLICAVVIRITATGFDELIHTGVGGDT